MNETIERYLEFKNNEPPNHKLSGLYMIQMKESTRIGATGDLVKRTMYFPTGSYLSAFVAEENTDPENNVLRNKEKELKENLCETFYNSRIQGRELFEKLDSEGVQEFAKICINFLGIPRLTIEPPVDIPEDFLSHIRTDDILYWCLWKSAHGYYVDIQASPTHAAFLREHKLVACYLVDSGRYAAWDYYHFEVLMDRFEKDQTYHQALQAFFDLDCFEDDYQIWGYEV